jgi:hypothetical protein
MGSSKDLVSTIALATFFALASSMGACGDSDSATPGGSADGADGGGGDGSTVGDGGAGDSGPAEQKALCNSEDFCFEQPLPHGYAMNAVWSAAPNDVWASAYPGAILHFDGARWTQVDLRSMPTSGANLHAIWGSSANDVWAGGYEYAGDQRELLFHYDGKAWTLNKTFPSGSPDFHHLNRIWGSGPSDVWAIGDTGTHIHWDGASWSTRTAFTNARLAAISGTSSNDVWVMPENYAGNATVWHFDGATWSSSAVGATPATAVPTALWASAPNDAWLAGIDYGVGDGAASMRHFDGQTWTSTSLPASIRSLWGSGPKDVWGAGAAGVVHYDGTSWTMVPADGAPRSLHGIWGSAANDVWAVDFSSTFLHFDGTKWSSPAPAAVQAMSSWAFESVWAAPTNDVWAVGIESGFDASGLSRVLRGVIARRTARGWERADVAAAAQLHAVHGFADNDVWSVGANGTALHYDGASWASVSSGTTATLSSVWSRAPNDAWAVGYDEADGGARTPVTIHFDGTSWSAIPIAAEAGGLQSVWGAGADDVWAANGTSLWHYQGSSWTMVPDVKADAFGSSVVWGLGPNDVWAGLWHYDGAAWTLRPSEPHVGLVASWGRSANDVWWLDSMGNVLHFDGAQARYVSTVGTAGSLTGAGNDMWLVGSGGAILHKAL